MNQANQVADGGVTVSDSAGIRHIILDRADKKNAMTNAMWIALGTAFATAAEAGNGVVLISGRPSSRTSAMVMGWLGTRMPTVFCLLSSILGTSRVAWRMKQ